MVVKAVKLILLRNHCNRGKIGLSRELGSIPTKCNKGQWRFIAEEQGWGNFPGGSEGKGYACNAGNARNMGSSPRSGVSPGEGHGNRLQYLCKENLMDRGACQAAVHGFSRVDMSVHVCSRAGERTVEGKSLRGKSKNTGFLLNQARIDRMAGFWLKAGQGDHGSTGG